MAHIVIDARHRQSSTGRYIDQLATHLQEVDRTNRYTLLLSEDDPWEPTSSRFTSVRGHFPVYSFHEQLGLWRQLERLRPDLVHFAMPQQPLLYRGATVTTIHDLTLVKWKNYHGNRLVYDVKQLIFRFLLKRVARHSSAVITPSAFTRSEVAAYAQIPAESICVTHEAGDLGDVAPAPVVDLAGRRFVLYVGNAFPYKNLGRLVTAWRTVVQQHPDATLVAVGRRSSYYDELAQQAPASVTFLHDVDDAQLAWLYQNAALFVFPSLSEGFGLPGLEAMAQGCPVLASSATSLPEVYGDAARYFDPLDPAALAEEIADLLRDDAARAAMSHAGRVHARTFSWRRTAEQTLDVYRQVLSHDG